MYTDSGMYTEEERKFIDRYDSARRGLRFVSIGVFGLLMAAGYMEGWPWSSIWRPVTSVAVFGLAYGSFLCFRSWYRRRKLDPADLVALPIRDHGAFWACLGISLAVLMLLGAAAGFAASAAGLVLAIWVFAYRFVYRRVWRAYTILAVLLAISSGVPPVLGLPMPEVLPVLFLFASGISFILIGFIDHVHWVLLQHNNIPRVEQ